MNVLLRRISDATQHINEKAGFPQWPMKMPGIRNKAITVEHVLIAASPRLRCWAHHKLLSAP